MKKSKIRSIKDKKVVTKDLFGNPVYSSPNLRDCYIEPPFTVIDGRATGKWMERKRQWKALGIQSEIGREAKAFNNYKLLEDIKNQGQNKINVEGEGTSIFDPVLTELMYQWFCPKGGRILDPFAGGSVRGIVAHYLGYQYTGIELRKEQVKSNQEQAWKILDRENQPHWITGDSENHLMDMYSRALDLDKDGFDFIFSCPPYVNLEIYSDLPGDLSNMKYPDFLEKYRSIIKWAIELLKPGAFACFIVGEVRDSKGYCYNFVGDTKTAFIEAGALLYNDCVFLNPVGSASIRAAAPFDASRKLTKIHQNVLVFKKIGG